MFLREEGGGGREGEGGGERGREGGRKGEGGRGREGGGREGEGGGGREREGEGGRGRVGGEGGGGRDPHHTSKERSSPYQRVRACVHLTKRCTEHRYVVSPVGKGTRHHTITPCIHSEPLNGQTRAQHTYSTAICPAYGNVHAHTDTHSFP